MPSIPSVRALPPVVRRRPGAGAPCRTTSSWLRRIILPPTCAHPGLARYRYKPNAPVRERTPAAPAPVVLMIDAGHRTAEVPHAVHPTFRAGSHGLASYPLRPKLEAPEYAGKHTLFRCELAVSAASTAALGDRARVIVNVYRRAGWGSSEFGHGNTMRLPMSLICQSCKTPESQPESAMSAPIPLAAAVRNRFWRQGSATAGAEPIPYMPARHYRPPHLPRRRAPRR